MLVNLDKCSCCGKCCSNYLPLSNNEIKQLKTLIKEKNIKPNKQIFTSDWYSVCPFLNNSNRCIIYESRPNICKLFTCNRFKFKNYDNIDESIIKEGFRLVDLRRDLFK